MFCLLCHEKISRLRAWRTKSEFCCDEHAEIYKKQTLERLLTDQESNQSSDAPPLPVELRSEETPGEATSETRQSERITERFEDAATLPPPVQEPPPSGSELDPATGLGRDEGIDELYRLAEEVGPGRSDESEWDAAPSSDAGGLGLSGSSPFGPLGGGGSSSGTVREQSAEEALAALRELSAQRGSHQTAVEESADELDTLLSARGLDSSQADEQPVAEEEDPAAVLEAGLQDDSFPDLDAALEPLDEDDLPSIFERLTEDSASREQADELEPLEDLEPADLELLAAGQQDLAAAEVEQAEASGEAPAELEQPAEAASFEEADSTDTLEEVLEAGGDAAEPASQDVFEEAVESHLEDEPRAEERKPSRKVVPFPLSRPKTEQPERQQSTEKPAAASDKGAAASKSAKGKKARRPFGDAGRLKLKPVAMMFGLEPSLCEPDADSGDWSKAEWAQSASQDAPAEPTVHFPQAGSAGNRGMELSPELRLRLVMPRTPEPADFEIADDAVHQPAYALPCQAPPPLALARNGGSRPRPVGAVKAWMFRIEPSLAAAPDFDMGHANGTQLLEQSLEMPAPLLRGMAAREHDGKLDLRGPDGEFMPLVDRLLAVLPNLGELGGSQRNTSSSTGEQFEKWMPATVLDPRFEIERPAGRELSDFG